MTQLINQVVSETANDARAIGWLSAAVGVSRATYYRQRTQQVQPAADRAETERRQAIQRIALEMPTYGHRPMTAELQRQNLPTGRDRVLRYMREANLLCRRRRAFVATTDSKHSLKVFPNLTRDLSLTAIDQLWVADITYHPFAARLRLPGRAHGRFQSARHRLGSRAPYDDGVAHSRTADGAGESSGQRGPDSSLGPG